MDMFENSLRKINETIELWLLGFFFKLCPLISSQVMETKDMLYIVTEFAKNGEMFGKSSLTELTVP